MQPADEPDWEVAPFGAEMRDLPGIGAVVVHRGAANSKGTLAASLLAMKSIAAVDDLPCSVTFLLDGEEELGSPNLPGVVEARRDDLDADAAYDLDLMADRTGTPEIFLGCKGILSLRLSCEGGDWGGPVGSALHSSNGVLIASPAWSVVRALSMLVDHQEVVTIPHLDKPPIPDEDGPLLDDLATGFDPDAYLVESNARRYKKDLSTREMAEALAYEPVVNINGLFAGREPGDKTIVPDRADVVVDIRIPYGTDIDAVERSVRSADRGGGPRGHRHAKRDLPSGAHALGFTGGVGDDPVARGCGSASARVARGPVVGSVLLVRARPRIALRDRRGRSLRGSTRRQRVRERRRVASTYASVGGPAVSLRGGDGDEIVSIAVARAAGTPRRMGQAQGEAMAEGISSALRFYGQLAGGREDAMAAATTPYIDATRNAAPHLLEEMEGLAEGAGISFEEAAILNCMEEVWDFEACTSMSHGPFLLHAEQWYAGHDSIGVVVCEPDDGPPFVSPTCAGFLPAVGMNASGFAQGIDSLTAADDRVGVPRVAISRLALGAAGLEAAIEAATSDGQRGRLRPLPQVERPIRCGGDDGYRAPRDRRCARSHQPLSGRHDDSRAARRRPVPRRGWSGPDTCSRTLPRQRWRIARGSWPTTTRNRNPSASMRKASKVRDGLRDGVRRDHRPDARLGRIPVSR